MIGIPHEGGYAIPELLVDQQVKMDGHFGGCSFPQVTCVASQLHVLRLVIVLAVSKQYNT
jgi:hypothetical protein